jgi:DNA repair exonuclease SbcCD ATPase subunit
VGTHLLQGSSGTGKSTIINAIYWVLYGTLKNPRTFGKGSSCSVTMIYGKCTISRQTRPSRLEVKKGDVKLLDAAAQEDINRMFGTHDEFLLSSMIKQKDQASIIFATPMKQKEIISKLAASEEIVVKYKGILKDSIKTEETRTAKESSRLRVYEEQLNELEMKIKDVELMLGDDMDSLKDIDPDKWFEQYRSAKSTLGDIENSLEQCQENISEIFEIISLRDELEEVRCKSTSETSTIKKQINDINKQFLTAEEETEMEEISTEINFRKLRGEYKDKKRQYMTAMKMRNPIKDEYNELKSSIESDLQTCSDNEKEAKELSACIHNFENFFKMIGKSVNELLENVPGTYDVDRLNTHLSYTELLEEVEYIKATISQVRHCLGITTSTYTALQRNAQEGDILECPSCATSLVLKSGKLVKSIKSNKSDNFTPPEIIIRKDMINPQGDRSLWEYYNEISLEHSRISSLLEKNYKKIEKNYVDIPEKYRGKNLEGLYDELDVCNHKVDEIEEDKKHLSVLEKSMGIPDDVAATGKRATTLKGRIAGLYGNALSKGYTKEVYSSQSDDVIRRAHDQFNARKKSYDQYNGTISRLKRTIDTQEKILEEKEENYMSQLENMGISGDDLDDIYRERSDTLEAFKQEHADKKEEYDQLTETLESVRIYTELINYRKGKDALLGQIATTSIELEESTSNLQTLAVIKNHLEHAEVNAIKTVIKTINIFAKNYLDTMFEEPITVELSATTETQKGKTRYEPSVHIAYRGEQYASVHQLSGGEQDRVSLAFILAVNEMTHSKILMLDESLASLHTEQNSSIIEGLNNIARHKMVLVVQHNGVDGVFDHLIKMEE